MDISSLYTLKGVLNIVEYPEIKTPHAGTETRNNEVNPGKKYEKKTEEQKGPGKRPEIQSGIPSEEFCISCMNMPEDQRKSMILEIQHAAENVLKAHGVIKELQDLLKGEWFLKLEKPGFEKKLVIAKSGEEVFIGFYAYSGEIPVPDPNLVLLSQYGFWYPQRIEEKFEETVASFFTGAYGDYEFLNIIPENVVKFQDFQRSFAKTLENQGWDGPDIKVVEKIMPED